LVGYVALVALLCVECLVFRCDLFLKLLLVGITI